MANVKKNTTLKSNGEIGFFKSIENIVKQDTEIFKDTFNNMTKGSSGIAEALDEGISRFHGVTGGSILKTGLRASIYGGGLLAVADFLNPFSLGWND